MATYHGTPGSSLLASDLPRQRIAAGVAGEKRLDALIRSCDGYLPHTHVFYSVMCPGKNFDADALVVAGNTVTMIDVKNWASGYDYYFTPTPRGAHVTRRLAGAPDSPFESFAGGDISILAEASSWSHYLSCSIQSVLVITGSHIGIYGEPSFQVLNEETLPFFLTSHFSTATAPHSSRVSAIEQCMSTPSTAEKSPLPLFILSALTVLGVIVCIVTRDPLYIVLSALCFWLTFRGLVHRTL